MVLMRDKQIPGDSIIRYKVEYQGRMFRLTDFPGLPELSGTTPVSLTSKLLASELRFDTDLDFLSCALSVSTSEALRRGFQQIPATFFLYVI